MSISKQDFKILANKVKNMSKTDSFNMINNIKNTGLTNDYAINSLIKNYSSGAIAKYMGKISNFYGTKLIGGADDEPKTLAQEIIGDTTSENTVGSIVPSTTSEVPPVPVTSEENPGWNLSQAVRDVTDKVTDILNIKSESKPEKQYDVETLRKRIKDLKRENEALKKENQVIKQNCEQLIKDVQAHLQNKAMEEKAGLYSFVNNVTQNTESPVVTETESRTESVSNLIDRIFN